MHDAYQLVFVRIAWCRRQCTLADTEYEVDGWRAEEAGLRDALLNKDHTDHYRLSPPEILERYMLGFQDGTVMLRAARIDHILGAHKGDGASPTSIRP